MSRSMRLLLGAMGVAVSGVAALSISRASLAAEPAGATFLDSKPIVLNLTAGASDQPLDLAVVNGSAGSVTLTLSLVGVSLPDKVATFPVRPAPRNGVIDTQRNVVVGGTWKPVVAVSLGEAKPGDYAAQFVVYASDGSVDRRDITLVVAAPSADPVAPPTPSPSPLLSDGLGEPLPSIMLASERWTWPFNDTEFLSPATIKLDPSVFPKLVPGALVSEDGRLAPITIDAAGNLTASAPATGAFKGILGRLPEDKETAPAKLTDITLNVRDAWLWPLAFLVTGLAIALAVEWLSTDWLPRMNLNGRLAALRERAETLCNDRRGWLEAPEPPRWLGGNRTPLSIDGETGDGRPAVLTQAIRDATEDFTATPSAEKRSEKWGSRGSEFVKIVDTVSQYEVLLESQLRINQMFEAIEARLPDEGKPELLAILGRSGMRLEVGDALAGNVIQSASAFNATKANLEVVERHVGRAKAVADLLAGMTPRDGFGGEIVPLWLRLVQLGSSKLSEIEQLEKDVQAFAKSYRAPVPEEQVEYSFRLFAEGSMSQDELLSALLGNATLLAPPTVPTLPDIDPLVKTPAQIRASLQTWTVLFSLIVIASVTVVAMTTQYFGKATFGTPGDYLGMLGWGFVGTAGAKLIGQLGTAATSLFGAPAK